MELVFHPTSLKNLKELKAKLYTWCLSWIDEKIELAKTTIAHAQSSANEETKSSAGDKYETGRAMAQQEVEKGLIQLAEATRLRSAIGKYAPGTTPDDIIRQGSLVHTDQGWFYISISAGKVVIDGHSVICLSAQSPLGAQMMGLPTGHTFGFNNLTYAIREIY